MNSTALEKAAIRDDRPVLFLARKRLHRSCWPVPFASPLQDEVLPGRARIEAAIRAPVRGLAVPVSHAGGFANPPPNLDLNPGDRP